MNLLKICIVTISYSLNLVNLLLIPYAMLKQYNTETKNFYRRNDINIHNKSWKKPKLPTQVWCTTLIIHENVNMSIWVDIHKPVIYHITVLKQTY